VVAASSVKDKAHACHAWSDCSSLANINGLADKEWPVVFSFFILQPTKL
jgi:hypothetical protein